MHLCVQIWFCAWHLVVRLFHFSHFCSQEWLLGIQRVVSNTYHIYTWPAPIPSLLLGHVQAACSVSAIFSLLSGRPFLTTFTVTGESESLLLGPCCSQTKYPQFLSSKAECQVRNETGSVLVIFISTVTGLCDVLRRVRANIQ